MSFCELIAYQCSLAIQRRDPQLIKDCLSTTVERNEDLLAARLSRNDGRELATSGDAAVFEDTSGFHFVTIPLYAKDVEWGRVELVFVHHVASSSILSFGFIRFLLIVGVLCGLAIHMYLRRVLRHLDPSKVVPDRVKTTLDTLAEGLVVLDQDSNIVLANQAFGTTVATVPENLQGKSLDEFRWSQTTGIGLPWETAIEEHRLVANQVLELELPNQKPRKFRVTCSPISNSSSECQGALVSFDDVTMLEARTSELQNMLEKLRDSRDKISQQNQQLTVLATRDPLTGAYNRRSLFEKMNEFWYGEPSAPVGCIMVDIDHFKSINDGHGHAMGDYVLKEAAKVFHDSVRPEDVVGRYGGEEFCIMLPHASLELTVEVAERIRTSLEAHDFKGLSVTASFGASERIPETSEAEEMIDFADRSLYIAKRTGRNQVTSYLELDKHVEEQEPDVEPVRVEQSSDVVIPFQTVSALTAALAYRDVDTAQHSRRVASPLF